MAVCDIMQVVYVRDLAPHISLRRNHMGGLYYVYKAKHAERDLQ